MPPKRRLVYAKPDGTGNPPKLVYADPDPDDAVGWARERYRRDRAAADKQELLQKAERDARHAARELAKAKEQSPDEDVNFEVVVPDAPPARRKSKANDAKGEAGREVKAKAKAMDVGQDPDRVEFRVTLTGGEAERVTDEADDVVASRVRDLSRGAKVQPAVTAAARTAKRVSGAWDPYLLHLLEEAFSTSGIVVLLVETVIMAERWWPRWDDTLSMQLRAQGKALPKILVGMNGDDLHEVVMALSRGSAALPADLAKAAPMVKAFEAWRLQSDSELMVFAPVKDPQRLSFSTTDVTATSFSKLVILIKGLAQKVRTFACFLRHSCLDHVELRRAAEVVASVNLCTVYVATQTREDDHAFPKVHAPFGSAVQYWLNGRVGDLTPRCVSRPYGRPAAEAAQSEEADEPWWGGSTDRAHRRSSLDCYCSRSAAGVVAVADECPVHGQRGAAASGKPRLVVEKATPGPKPEARASASAVAGAQLSSRALTEAGAAAGVSELSELPKSLRTSLSEMRVVEDETAYDFALDGDQRVGGVLRFRQSVQNEVCAAVFYKLRASKHLGLVMKDLARGDPALLTSGWTYFLEEMQRLEPEADKRRAAEKAFADLAQGETTLTRFNIQFLAAVARVSAAGGARHFTFDSLAADYIEKLSDVSLRLVVTQAYKQAKVGWASDGPLDVTGRDALKKLLGDAADMANRSMPGPAAQAASAAVLRTWSPPRTSDRSNQPRRQEGFIVDTQHEDSVGSLTFQDLTPEDKAMAQHWAGPRPSLYLAYVAASKEGGACFMCGKTGHWARENKCQEAREGLGKRPCLDYARGKCRFGMACMFWHDLRTRPRVAAEHAPALRPRKRPRTPSPLRAVPPRAAVSPPRVASSSAAGPAQGGRSRNRCYDWDERGSCRRGEQCRFSHGQRRQATSRCRMWENSGRCSYGNRCNFSHDSEGQQRRSTKKPRREGEDEQKRHDSEANGGGASRN